MYGATSELLALTALSLVLAYGATSTLLALAAPSLVLAYGASSALLAQTAPSLVLTYHVIWRCLRTPCWLAHTALVLTYRYGK